MIRDGYINCVKSVALNIDYLQLKMQFDKKVSSVLWSASLVLQLTYYFFKFLTS